MTDTGSLVSKINYVLVSEGLHECASYISQRKDQLDPCRFMEILTTPGYFVNIPLSCIYWHLGIVQNEITEKETEELLKAIYGFKEQLKFPDKMIGEILDHIFTANIRYRVCTTIRELTNLFSYMKSSYSTAVLNNFDSPQGQQNFWAFLYACWMLPYFQTTYDDPGIHSFARIGDLSLLDEIFRQASPEKVREFREDFHMIQTSSNFIAASQWQRILVRNAGEEEKTIAVLHSAVIGRAVVNWTSGRKETVDEKEISFQMASIIMALVKERQWRYADVTKLFRFQQKHEDLNQIQAVLLQIYEGNLKSSALDKLTCPIVLEEIEEIAENNMEYPQPKELSRDEAILHIVNSDFNDLSHGDANLTDNNLRQMMNAFDSTYNGGNGQYAHEVKAIRAIESTFGLKMRDVQILAVLLATQARAANISRLLQMQTGEGKTYVIAAIAIVEALNKRKVDIVTSSEKLAITQSEELRKLYTSLGISVKHNCDDDRKKKEEQRIYEADIVYGDSCNFMFDVLYEEFWESKLRCNRGFPLLIIDEVDSQMLDRPNHVCRFASTASGMGNLLGIQTIIWMLVSQNFQELKYENNLWKIPNGNGYVDVYDTEILKAYFKEGLIETVKKSAGFLPGAKESEKIDIPQSLREYCEREIPFWIESAVDAYLKKQNFDYCCRCGPDQIRRTRRTTRCYGSGPGSPLCCLL